MTHDELVAMPNDEFAEYVVSQILHDERPASTAENNYLNNWRKTIKDCIIGVINYYLNIHKQKPTLVKINHLRKYEGKVEADIIAGNSKTQAESFCFLKNTSFYGDVFQIKSGQSAYIHINFHKLVSTDLLIKNWEWNDPDYEN